MDQVRESLPAEATAEGGAAGQGEFEWPESQQAEADQWAQRVLRYCAAGVLICVAYVFLNQQGPQGQRDGWMAVGCVLLALLCAHEVVKRLLGLVVLCVLAWALFAGIAALPVSVAVIVGACIIASAAKGR